MQSADCGRSRFIVFAYICLIMKICDTSELNMCSIECYYSCRFLNNTMLSGIRNIILQQDKSRPTCRTCNRGGQNLPFFAELSILFFGGLTDHFELKLQLEYVYV